MLTCALTTNQAALFFSIFSPPKVDSAHYFQLVSLSPQHLGIWPLRCRTLAFCMILQIWVCYSTVWHFQRLQPLLVHLVSSMSMFLCSTWVFPGHMWGLQTGWSAPTINSQQAFCDLYCLSFLPCSSSSNQWTWGLSNRLQNRQCTSMTLWQAQRY